MVTFGFLKRLACTNRYKIRRYFSIVRAYRERLEQVNIIEKTQSVI